MNTIETKEVESRKDRIKSNGSYSKGVGGKNFQDFINSQKEEP
jgi:hypothetical protein